MFSGVRTLLRIVFKREQLHMSGNILSTHRTSCQLFWKEHTIFTSWTIGNCGKYTKEDFPSRKGPCLNHENMTTVPSTSAIKEYDLRMFCRQGIAFIHSTAFLNSNHFLLNRRPLGASGSDWICRGISTVRHSSSSSDSNSKQYYSDKRTSSRQKLYYTLKHYIKSPETAEKFVSHLKEDEKRLLLTALESAHGIKEDREDDSAKISNRQLWLVFIHNCVPFVGFGFLDNAIMILAGDLIDQTIGVTLGITTMAAAALGNTVSDLAGVGLAGYVEMLFYKLGLPVAALTPEQTEQTSAILSSNSGKAFGIIVGCLLGMLPLLFIKERSDDDEEEDLS